MVDDSTQTCSVIDYTGNAPTVVIPDTYKGYLVTSIGDMTFFNCYGLTSVTFENTQGWKAESTEISSNDLANAETAASYLKETYDEYTWTRS